MAVGVRSTLMWKAELKLKVKSHREKLKFREDSYQISHTTGTRAEQSKGLNMTDKKNDQHIKFNPS
jgi:hypothetical protein